MSTKLKFRKGDKVIVLTGKEKGKRGEILKVKTAEMRAVVQGVNMAKRHTRPGRGQTGGIVEQELSIHLSNLAHVDPKSNEATRIGYKFLDDGRKVRFAKKSGEVIDS
mgnify:CR=1 FL=1